MSAQKLTEEERLKRFHDRYIPEPNSGCWLWIGGISTTGYGAFHNGNKTESAHRFSWKIHKGEIVKEEMVLHKCDTRACVNPYHLFLGDHGINMRDCVSKGRHPKKKSSFCKRGHALVADNLYTRHISPTFTARYCKACYKVRAKKGS